MRLLPRLAGCTPWHIHDLGLEEKRSARAPAHMPTERLSALITSIMARPKLAAGRAATAATAACCGHCRRSTACSHSNSGY